MRTLIFCLMLLICLRSGANAQIDSGSIAKVRASKPFLKFGKRSGQLVLSLEKLFVKDEVYYLGFSIRNTSRLSYPIELFRLYIKDENAARRSSVQELELIPLYADSITTVASKKRFHFVIALSKFTIPDNKICLLEMFETSGGRNLTLEITNRQLFLAKPLKDNSSSSTLHQ